MSPSTMDSRRIKRVHRASMAGILASLAYLAIGLVAAAVRAAEYHVFMMAGGVLVAFVVAVESSYVVSPMRAKSHPLMGASYAFLVASPIIAALAPPIGVALGLGAWSATLIASLALEVIPALVGASLSRGSVRASLAASAFSNALTAVYLGVAAHTLRGNPVLVGLGLLYAFPVPMIFAVSLHAFPSTYGRKPLWPLLPLPFALAAAASLGLAVEARPAPWILVAAALSLVAYIPAARIHEAPRIAGEVSRERKPPIVVKTHKYFLWGHVYVAIIVAYILYLASLRAAGWPVRLGCLIHATAIGFAGLHIFIHAPMMLPVILGIPTARRYNVSPYALLAIAAAAPCVGHYPNPLMWASLLAALAAAVLVVWPPPRKPRGREGRRG